jgi:hypothetical protein
MVGAMPATVIFSRCEQKPMQAARPRAATGTLERLSTSLSPTKAEPSDPIDIPPTDRRNMTKTVGP